MHLHTKKYILLINSYSKEDTTINEKEYSVVRVALIKRDGKPIHKEPMLLISTIKITNYLDAKEIYHIYLHRAKIEGVFKFLKDTLGWEEYARASRQNTWGTSKRLGIY